MFIKIAYDAMCYIILFYCLSVHIFNWNVAYQFNTFQPASIFFRNPPSDPPETNPERNIQELQF